jgi:hypothetical protein
LLLRAVTGEATLLHWRRAARDVHFISRLMVHRVPFLVADLDPDVDPFILHQFAALAQKKRALIRKLTTEASAAAKARGITFGNPKIGEARYDQSPPGAVRGCRLRASPGDGIGAMAVVAYRDNRQPATRLRQLRRLGPGRVGVAIAVAVVVRVGDWAGSG